MAWRDRRTEAVPLELWEVLAHEYESGASDHPHIIPPGFDAVAETAVQAKKAYDRDPSQPHSDAWDIARNAVEGRLFQEFEQTPRSALCFSGGGVRSATFGLGVLQGLIRNGVVPSQFDYLSTVSGGGYVGSWFSAWAKHELVPGAAEAALAARPSATLDGEPDPLQHIRKYSAFLNPKLGALSADTWTLVSTILRNMILNWLVLIPAMMAVVLLPDLYTAFLPPEFYWSGSGFPDAMLILGFVSAVFGTSYILSQLPTFSSSTSRGETDFVKYALLPLTVAALALTVHWAWHVEAYGNYGAIRFVLFGGIVHLSGALIAASFYWWRTGPGKKAMVLGLVTAIVSGGMTGGVAYFVSTYFEGHIVQYGDAYVCLAVPIVLVAFSIAAMIMVGLSSRRTSDQDREWWARAGAWLLIVTTCWLVASAAVTLGHHLPDYICSAYTWISSAIATMGIGGIASKLGFSPKTSAGGPQEDMSKPATNSGNYLDIIAQLAGAIFLLLLVGVLALANDFFVAKLQTGLPVLAESVAVLWGILLVIAAIASWFINVNQFSLHAMYRNRLVRTYLGASNPQRDEDLIRFIDQSMSDNFAMHELCNRRPMHIVNMTLNLVASKNLAWQQRKAESFTSSRLHTGSLWVGYQDSHRYGDKKNGGISLGSAVAISGAAASPNMGYHSSPLLSFVMTLFNARLGWWLANPGRNGGRRVWGQDGPTWALVPIVSEALGRTNDDKKWVYLSDGGHFENLGLYEMVLRRSKIIVVVDGSGDPTYQFEDLANAIRKVRVDLGVPIEFGAGSLGIAGKNKKENRYCGVATIKYTEATPAGADGTLVYIKACLNGTEPTDVLNYSAANVAFPQQGTEELWFNESQFESYRKLGEHIVEQIAAKTGGPSTSLAQFVGKVTRYIASPNP